MTKDQKPMPPGYMAALGKLYSTKETTMTESERQRQALCESGMAVVANINKDRGLIEWAKQSGRFVYIGRYSKKHGLPASKWANPYVMLGEGTRKKACGLYVQNQPFLLADIAELKGMVLVCYCHPKRCHGDHLADLVNGL